MMWPTRFRKVWATGFFIVPTVVRVAADFRTSSPTALRSGL
jgi:hypothetical protein